MKQKYYQIGKCIKCGKTIFHVRYVPVSQYIRYFARSDYKYFWKNLEKKIKERGSVEKGITYTFFCKCGNVLKKEAKYQAIKDDRIVKPRMYLWKSDKWTGIKIRGEQ